MKYYLYRHIRMDTKVPFYIGIGTKIERKFYYNHKSEFSRAYKKTDRNKYWTNITSKVEYEIEIILESDNYEYIKSKEIEFIKLYGRKDLKQGILVNVTDGGEGVTGLVFSSTHKMKMSESAKNRKTWFKGKKLSSEHIQNLIDSHLGIPNKHKGKSYIDLHGVEKSKEIKNKQSLIRKGKYIGEKNNFYGKSHSDESKIKMGTPVIQMTLSGKIIDRYLSLTEAANITGSTASLIQKVCKGNRSKHNGFKWKYENPNNTRQE